MSTVFVPEKTLQNVDLNVAEQRIATRPDADEGASAATTIARNEPPPCSASLRHDPSHLPTTGVIAEAVLVRVWRHCRSKLEHPASTKTPSIIPRILLELRISPILPWFLPCEKFPPPASSAGIIIMEMTAWDSLPGGDK